MEPKSRSLTQIFASPYQNFKTATELQRQETFRFLEQLLSLITLNIGEISQGKLNACACLGSACWTLCWTAARSLP